MDNVHWQQIIRRCVQWAHQQPQTQTLTAEWGGWKKRYVKVTAGFSSVVVSLSEFVSCCSDSRERKKKRIVKVDLNIRGTLSLWCKIKMVNHSCRRSSVYDGCCHRNIAILLYCIFSALWVTFCSTTSLFIKTKLLNHPTCYQGGMSGKKSLFTCLSFSLKTFFSFYKNRWRGRVPYAHASMHIIDNSLLQMKTRITGRRDLETEKKFHGKSKLCMQSLSFLKFLHRYSTS